MTKNPLRMAQASGLQANKTVGDLFARVGSGAHPRGFVSRAYRNAGRALRTALAEENPLFGIDDVMSGLRASVESETRAMLQEAKMSGMEEAQRQLSFYDIASSSRIATPNADAQQAEIMAAVMAQVEAQHMTIRALALTGGDEQVLGNDERAGALRESSIESTLAAYIAALCWGTFSDTLGIFLPPQSQYKKQAIAALDERTTDCCLRVHGQIQPLNRPFNLTGTPRFADRMDWPGFHWYCRTAGVLYLPEYDLGLTDAMRSGASKILRERASGGTGARNPANAMG